MSKNPQKSARAKSRNYRNPPAEHRFKKGQSGNPKGRPRKDREPVHSALVEVEGEVFFAVEDPANAIILREADRIYRLREGDRFAEISAFEAMVRRGFAAAANGSMQAVRQMLPLVLSAQASRSAAKALAFANALELQRRNRDLLDRCEKNGLPPPDVVPHPDDMRFNPENLTVEYFGPITKAERDYLDGLHDQRPFIEDALRKAEERLAANPQDKNAREARSSLSILCDQIKADEAHWRLRQARKYASSHREGWKP
jgi:Family of unknown function (DUF5681)